MHQCLVIVLSDIPILFYTAAAIRKYFCPTLVYNSHIHNGRSLVHSRLFVCSLILDLPLFVSQAFCLARPLYSFQLYGFCFICLLFFPVFFLILSRCASRLQGSLHLLGHIILGHYDVLTCERSCVCRIGTLPIYVCIWLGCNLPSF